VITFMESYYEYSFLIVSLKSCTRALTLKSVLTLLQTCVTVMAGLLTKLIPSCNVIDAIVGFCANAKPPCALGRREQLLSMWRC